MTPPNPVSAPTKPLKEQNPKLAAAAREFIAHFVESPKGTPEGEAEIDLTSSVSDLSDKDLSELRRFAQYRMMRLKGRIFASDETDLLQEAMRRTLEGKRIWNRQVNFVQHLKGCMYSIANEWGKEASRASIFSRSVIENHQIPTKEREAYATICYIREHLRGDQDAEQILDLLLDGYQAAEIQTLLGITTNVYNAARKRVSRKIQSLLADVPGQGK